MTVCVLLIHVKGCCEPCHANTEEDRRKGLARKVYQFFEQQSGKLVGDIAGITGPGPVHAMDHAKRLPTSLAALASWNLGIPDPRWWAWASSLEADETQPAWQTPPKKDQPGSPLHPLLASRHLSRIAAHSELRGWRPRQCCSQWPQGIVCCGSLLPKTSTLRALRFPRTARPPQTAFGHELRASTLDFQQLARVKLRKLRLHNGTNCEVRVAGAGGLPRARLKEPHTGIALSPVHARLASNANHVEWKPSVRRNPPSTLH